MNVFRRLFCLSVVLLASVATAFACQVEYSDGLVEAMRRAGHPVSKRVGNFASLQECQAALEDAVLQSGDPSLAYNMQCVGCGDGGGGQSYRQPASSSSGRDRRGQGLGSSSNVEDQAQKHREAVEQQRQQDFEKARQDLQHSLKGSGSGSSSLGLKTSGSSGAGMALKSGVPPSKPAPMQDPVEEKVREAQQRINKLRNDVAGIQGMLRQYITSLNNNAGDFTAWGETISTAYGSVLNNSKEYVTGLFLDYGLMNGLKSAQKESFQKLNGLLTPVEPKFKSWLLKELGGRNLDYDRFEKLVKLGLAEGDFAALVNTDNGLRKNLDTLILISDLLDVADVPAFKNHPFQHARMIGETYADLASICYGWHALNRLEKDTAKLSREADRLSVRMNYAMKEMECLDGCVQNYTDRCMEKCAGRTKLHSPPPLPR